MPVQRVIGYKFTRTVFLITSFSPQPHRKSRLFFKYWHQEQLAKYVERLERAALVIQKGEHWGRRIPQLWSHTRARRNFSPVPASLLHLLRWQAGCLHVRPLWSQSVYCLCPQWLPSIGKSHQAVPALERESMCSGELSWAGQAYDLAVSQGLANCPLEWGLVCELCELRRQKQMSLKQVFFLPSERGKRVWGLVGCLVDLIWFPFPFPFQVVSALDSSEQSTVWCFPLHRLQDCAVRRSCHPTWSLPVVLLFCMGCCTAAASEQLPAVHRTVRHRSRAAPCLLGGRCVGSVQRGTRGSCFQFVYFSTGTGGTIMCCR